MKTGMNLLLWTTHVTRDHYPLFAKLKATGFDGVWRCELLSPKYWELDPWQTARDLRIFLQYLLL